MKWLYRFFIGLGVIFFLLLCALGYFVVADPYNLRPIFMSMYGTHTSVESPVTTSTGEVVQTSNDKASTNPSVVSENQAKALQSVGIDPGAVPAKFTPEQTACFVQVLGQVRVDAIVVGATPTPAEFYKAKDCL